jgi:hypothetical protein
LSFPPLKESIKHVIEFLKVFTVPTGFNKFWIGIVGRKSDSPNLGFGKGSYKLTRGYLSEPSSFNRCENVKEHSHYFNDQKTADGLGANCKECKKEQKQSYIKKNKQQNEETAHSAQKI